MSDSTYTRRRVDYLWATIRRNIQFKFISEVICRAIQFAFILVAARRLGVNEFGVYAYASAWGFIFGQVCDLGLQIFVTREIARAAAESSRIIGAALSIKTLLFLVALVMLLGLVYTRSDRINSEVIFILALASLLTSYVEFFNYAFRGYQHLEFEAALNLVQRLLGPGLALIALLLGGSLRVVAWGLLLANVLVIVLSYYLLQKYFTRPSYQIKWESVWYALKEVLPLGLAIVFSGMYVRTGVLMLESMKTLSDVGSFNAAQRITEPLQILPAIGLAAIFPAFAAQGSMHVRRVLAGRTLTGLMPFACALALVGWFSARTIVNMVYGPDYAQSAGALQWLAVALIPMFLNYALTHFLIALGRQWLNALFTLIIFLVNLTLNAWLIPFWGTDGVAIAILFSELSLFILCALVITRQATSHEKEQESLNAALVPSNE